MGVTPIESLLRNTVAPSGFVDMVNATVETMSARLNNFWRRSEGRKRTKEIRRMVIADKIAITEFLRVFLCGIGSLSIVIVGCTDLEIIVRSFFKSAKKLAIC